MGDLISIVIPAYNAASYLENCLASVLHQTYQDIEIIIIDDGSEDHTLEIANHYRDKYPDTFQVIHTDNQGVTKARFEGIRNARGEWIGFVDADDEIEPDMYERLYENAKKYNADISHCGHRTIVNGGERIHDFYNTGCLIVQDRRRGLEDLLAGPVELSLCSKLFRKKLLQKLLQNEKMDKSIKYNEDLLMNFFLFQKSRKSIYEDFCGYHYLARNSSVTRRKFNPGKVLDPAIVWKIILDNVEPELQNLVWKEYLLACMRAYSCLIECADYKKEAARFRKILLIHRGKWRLLGRNARLKLFLVLRSPQLYNKLYQMYQKWFQRIVYE